MRIQGFQNGGSLSYNLCVYQQLFGKLCIFFALQTFHYMQKIWSEGLLGGAVVKGAVLQLQLCHQRLWVRAQALS